MKRECSHPIRPNRIKHLHRRSDRIIIKERYFFHISLTHSSQRQQNPERGLYISFRWRSNLQPRLTMMTTFAKTDSQTCGLLVQGYDCTLYQMDETYAPLYRMIEMGSFSLPKNAQELPLLPHAVETMLTCKGIVYRNAREVEDH
ncbi:hypothetical protein BX666DRAFT_414245 [Dichotomocladium elegans]|nr:hypothetical protein BX666DRAFT_414245 [Dichotomocladium elegans]